MLDSTFAGVVGLVQVSLFFSLLLSLKLAIFAEDMERIK